MHRSFAVPPGCRLLDAILAAAEHYIERENLFVLEEDQKVCLAIERLGLNSVAPFDPKEKIIEYIIAEDPDKPYKREILARAKALKDRAAKMSARVLKIIEDRLV